MAYASVREAMNSVQVFENGRPRRSGRQWVEEDVDDRSAMPIETSLREYPRQPLSFYSLAALCAETD